MDPDLRQRFNAAFSQDLYARMSGDLEAALGDKPAFRLAETPLFLPADLRLKCERAAREIIAIVSRPAMLEKLRGFVPPERLIRRPPRPEALRDPGGALPTMALVDLAIVRGASGALEPRLVEMQGFPSLFALTVIQLDVWTRVLAEIPGMPSRFTGYFDPFDRESFVRLFHRAVVGDHDPAEVVVVDLDPPSQKTWVDFAATRQLLGIEPICLTSLALDPSSRRLFRRVGGRRLPVRRIYNRVVFDEIDKKGVRFPFDFHEPIDVEWTPHPDWYWIWSKAALPFIEHPVVPRARLLRDIDTLPADLSRYVLKPLFSFAGLGVNVDVTKKDVDAVPAAERGQWMLQEKIAYEPALAAGDGGGVKAEIRMMFLRDPAEPDLKLALQLVRLSRGAMLGVDFNKDFTWVGSSVGLWPA